MLRLMTRLLSWKRLMPALLILSFAVFISACTPNQKIMESANLAAENTNTANVAPAVGRPLSTVEQDIQAMRNADFDFIFLFRRKDGAEMDADDKKFFNSFTPAETNRRRISDGGRAIIIGTNYRWPSELFKKFTERFSLEDYSKPENEIINSNANTNANKD